MHPKGWAETQQKIKSTSTHLTASNSTIRGKWTHISRLKQPVLIETRDYRNGSPCASRPLSKGRGFGAPQAWRVWSNVRFLTSRSRQSSAETELINWGTAGRQQQAPHPVWRTEVPKLSPGCSGATSLTGPHQSCCQGRSGAPCLSKPHVFSLPAATGTPGVPLCTTCSAAASQNRFSFLLAAVKQHAKNWIVRVDK